MAQVLIPNGYAQLAFHWSGPGTGSQPVNLIGVQINATGATLQEDIEFMAEVLAGMSTDDYALTKCVVRIGDAGGPPYAAFELPLDETGVRDVTSAPPNVSTLVRWSTLSVGRGKSGRIYVPGVDEGAVDDSGRMSDAYHTAQQEQVDVLLTLPYSGGAIDAIVVLHTEGSPLAGGGSSVIQGTADSLVATQRRRLRR